MATSEHLAQGFAESGNHGPSPSRDHHRNVPDGITPERRDHLIRGRSENFQPNEEYDEVLARLERDPAYADTLSSGLRMAVGFYANDKAAHHDLNG